VVTAITAAVVAAAVVVVAGLGGGDSIVQRAYAATSPAGAIVRYVEVTRGSAPADHQRVTYWVDGAESRQLIDVGRLKDRQQITTGHGVRRTLGLGLLVVMPLGPAPKRCSPELSLMGDCTGVANAAPVDGLRSLLHSGRLHASGHATVGGRRLDVLVGSTSGSLGLLRVRALVDARTFVPVRVTMVDALPKGHSRTGVVNRLTISGYVRLPETPRNLKLLALPAHAKVKLIRFHACPTRARPNRLCR
jgi:hypothetical protein